jgi:phosphatidylserine/phosphatidylglycerophosphate/cardiolipin synthase-like enzyme
MRGTTILASMGVVGLSCACGRVPMRPELMPAPLAYPNPSPLSLPAATALDTWTPVPLHVGFGARKDCCDVYFTDPTNPASGQFSGGVEGALVEAIDGARLSVHAAMYSLTLKDVRDALLRAHRRGIDVKVVMESDNIDADAPQRLREAGIPVLGDRREGLMHDKFMVIDGTEVWTGSMNYTTSGAYLDNNVLVRVRSRGMADDYETEFGEMFVDDHFGPQAGRPTPKPRITVNGIPMEVYFSPDDHIEAALIQLLGRAESKIDFLAYSFTSDGLGSAMVRAKERGVRVSGIMDADQSASNQGTELAAFRDAGIDVRLDGNPGQMHEKVLIVDGQTVALGSYNFSASAEKSNDENLLIIHDAALARLYLDEFSRIYALARP